MPTFPSDESLESSADDIFKFIYAELRQLARHQMSKEYAYSTLQSTALVHEAWLRLGADNQPQWNNRRHLYAAVSQAMRRILIERARSRDRQKNGGDLRRVGDERIDSDRPNLRLDDHIIKINEALESLEKIDPSKAELVRLRYFFGLSFEEIASTMDISLSTAKRWWTYSRSWLHREYSNL